MTTLQQFRTYEKLHESNSSVVYRAHDSARGIPVILKVLKSDTPNSSDSIRYQQEFEITSSLTCAGVIRANEYIVDGGVHAITLEDFGAESLAVLRKQANFPPLEAVKIIHAVATTLGEVHRQGIIHKDINPSNIVYNQRTRLTKLIDFGISSRIPRHRIDMVSPLRLEGTLAYMSPEQTGRMNRHIDHRADLYSLGATLYELLCARPPFTEQDPILLIHRHIAHPPTRPLDLVPGLPPMLSRLVERLLEKCAEDRYASAWGVAADLELCIAQLETGRHANFDLGARDTTGQLEIPQKLYGRESERQRLLDVFHLAKQGTSQVIFVSGNAGIGKTSLVQEIHKPVTLANGFYASGKFDQLQTIPYAAFAQALGDLVRQLLSTSNEELERWRHELLRVLRQDAQVMIEFLPDLVTVLGPQPPAQRLGPVETNVRFHRLLVAFLRAFSTKDHPLVFFLDDIQWADQLSFSIIDSILGEGSIEHLTLICSFRDTNLTQQGPISELRESLVEAGVSVHSLSLAELDEVEITAMIEDTFSLPSAQARELAVLTKTKTGGTPFFIGQILHALHDEGAITYQQGDHGALGSWTWDPARLDMAGFTDNVVDLMIEKLKRLPPAAQVCLQLAASLGNRFDLMTLSIIREDSLARVAAAIELASAAGHVTPTSELIAAPDQDGSTKLIRNQHRFLHDRIQQAAYALIPVEDRAPLHARIARLLISTQDPEARLFEIVDHLHRGTEPTSLDARVAFLDLTLRAVTKAMQATAFEAARGYANRAMTLLDPDVWSSRHDLAIAISTACVELESIAGHHELAETLAQAALTRAVEPLDRARIYMLLVMQRATLYRPREALEIGLRALSELGVELASDQAEIEATLLRDRDEIDAYIADRGIESLVDLDLCHDPVEAIKLDMLSTLTTPAYQVNPPLMGIMTTHIIKMSIRHGNRPDSIVGYSGYGILLGALFQEFEAGDAFSRISLALAEKLDDRRLRCMATHVHISHISHWVRGFDHDIPLVRRAVQQGHEVAERPYTGYMVAAHVWNRLARGEPLETLIPLCDESLERVTSMSNTLGRLMSVGARLILANLQGESASSREFAHAALREEQLLAEIERNDAPIAAFLFQIYKAQSLFMHEDYDEADRISTQMASLLGAVPGLVVSIDYRFYSALGRARALGLAEPAQRDELQQALDEHLRALGSAATACPTNAMHKFVLARAEAARARGDALAAIDDYDEAVELAARHGFVHIEALANHLAGRFWHERGKARIGAAYLLDAHACYRRWGATRIAEFVASKYGGRFSSHNWPTSSFATTSTVTTTSTGQLGASLDVRSLVEASRALASESSVDALLLKVMELSLLNAGAEQGALVLERNGQLLVKARGVCVPDTKIELLSMDMAEFRHASHAMVNYVGRSGETLVLDRAMSEGQFVHDPYVIANQCKSVLCMPLVNQGSLIAVVFMENPRVFGAFAGERIGLLQLLLTPAAVAIENALLKGSSDGFEYQVGGSLASAAQSYVSRRADTELLEALTDGEFCFVLSPRQMGKSSMRVRAMQKLRELSHSCVSIDLTMIGGKGVTEEQWYAGIASMIIQGLELKSAVNLRKWWVDTRHLSPVQRFVELLDTEVLDRVTRNITLFLDEIDSMLSLGFDGDNFFAMMRACINRRADDPRYGRLNFVLLGVASPSTLVRDTRRTPFNIGRGIYLGHFRLLECKALMAGLASKGNTEAIVKIVLAWTDGQPFLTQKICNILRELETVPALGQELEWVSHAVQARVLDRWEDRDEPVHLRAIQARVRHSPRRAELLRLYEAVLHRRDDAEPGGSLEAELLLSGLVVREPRGLRVACRIYEKVFDAQWIERLSAPPA
ncbi:High-affnity carbon uptake protein Hat/HatR [Enhygromyxa salina]|uniref:High-affnity carbon uptake protein Hat/HatR n=1 Tax=Enhygromyxa salina TaxID=215803 RepID=A0A0C2CM67_9BACT|nr:AAA family ATPase [Enhygromyxa salina]KIG12341.1 High-affnity carbon uptake protein Hat/HatR [Enhygromyxa salina]